MLDVPLTYFGELTGDQLFSYLLRDGIATRSEWLQFDEFSLMSHIWNKFIENCLVSYNQGENLTVDEQLFPTKARCKFTQYMANKPDKLVSPYANSGCNVAIDSFFTSSQLAEKLKKKRISVLWVP
ncbi:hypothetical protein PR048_016554 [Dryococelus australis]|uniref:PiggyBac transposable element-derived protein domain-containing protein n=1 Tax=Dryococelus australis TaxID=614101 RepID=A0ABQ9HK43_9NEOP|nr:hypothetical protein PR048_016554 [Dryococelus australis]